MTELVPFFDLPSYRYDGRYVDNQIIQAIKEARVDEARQLAGNNPFDTPVLKYVTDACRFDLLYDFLQLGFSRRLISLRFFFQDEIVRKGRADVIDFLYFERGMDPNLPIDDVLNMTILSLACLYGQRDIVERLLRCDANPEQCDKEEENSFFYALYCHDVNIFRMLFLQTGRIDYVDNNGENLLFKICNGKARSQEIFDEILSINSLDVNAQCRWGETALDRAIRWFPTNPSSEDRILTLIQHPDIDLTIRNDQGETAWDLCQRNVQIKDSIRDAIRAALVAKGISVP